MKSHTPGRGGVATLRAQGPGTYPCSACFTLIPPTSMLRSACPRRMRGTRVPDSEQSECLPSQMPSG